jgi:intein/homing endonuclease
VTYSLTCTICGQAFEGDRKNATYCSKDCKDEGRRRRQTSAPRAAVMCQACGLAIDKPYRTGQQYHGSPECQQKAMNIRRGYVPSAVLPTTRRCRNKDCIERFIPVNPQHWYHEPACSLSERLWSVEEILAEEGSLLPGGSHLEMAKAAFGQKNQALRENTRLRSLRDYLTFELRSFYDEHPEYRLPQVSAPNLSQAAPKRKDREVEVIVQCSDWQVGKWEDGFGVEATTRRLEQFKESVAAIVQRQQDAGWKVSRIVVAFGGDLVEGCVPAGTPIFTEDGPVPIESVCVGQRVWAQSETGLHLRRVTASAMTGIKPLLKVRTTERDIQLTDNHPVLVRRLERSSTGKGRPAAGFVHEWVEAGQLKSGDVLVGLDTLPEVDDMPDVTVGMMEFLGFYMGDGCLTRNATGAPNGIALAHERNAPYMEHYRNIAADLFTHSNGSTLVARVRKSGELTAINSTTASATIERLGFGGSALTKRVPGWVFRCSRAQRLAFLRGYLDADGHVNKLGQIIYASAQEAMLEDVRHLCMSVGLVVGKVRHQDRMVKPPKASEPRLHRMYFLNCGAPDLNVQVGTYTPIYSQRWAEAQGKRRVRRHDIRLRVDGERERLRSTPPDGCRYFRVLSVERGTVAQPVYNITVDTDQNYIANGIVHHNCFIYRGQNVSGLDRTSNTHRLTVQIRVVAHLMAEMVAYCAALAPEVSAQVVGGNHGRTNGRNDYADPEDNFDVMSGWWASDLTRNTPRIKWTVHEDWWGGFESLGHYVVMFHGDQWTGKFEALETLLPQWVTNGVFGAKPQIVLTHHRHDLARKNITGVKVYQNGTIDGGSKWYLKAFGRSSTPAQHVIVMSRHHAPESVWDVDF